MAPPIRLGERIAWIGSLLTNWIGDDGWLRRLRVEIDDGRGLIDLAVWAEDQRGERTAKGMATVELPTR